MTRSRGLYGAKAPVFSSTEDAIGFVQEKDIVIGAEVWSPKPSLFVRKYSVTLVYASFWRPTLFSESGTGRVYKDMGRKHRADAKTLTTIFTKNGWNRHKKERNTPCFAALACWQKALLALFWSSSRPTNHEAKITATSVRHHGLPVKTTAFKVKRLLNSTYPAIWFAVTQSRIIPCRQSCTANACCLGTPA